MDRLVPVSVDFEHAADSSIADDMDTPDSLMAALIRNVSPEDLRRRSSTAQHHGTSRTARVRALWQGLRQRIQ